MSRWSSARTNRFSCCPRFRDPESEGGTYRYHDFLHAFQDEGGWSLQSSSLGSDDPESSPEKPYRLLAGARGRTFLVADVSSGLAVQVRDPDGWRSLDPGEGLPADARATLGEEGQFGAAWIGSDDVLRVLHGAWLFEIAGDEIARAIDTGRPCLLEGFGSDCLFDPTGNLQGDAALYNHDLGKYTLSSLQCDAGKCQWTDVPGVDLGTSNDGGDSGPFRRVFFHTADGKATLVRPVDAATGGHYDVLACTTEREVTVISGGAYFIGAAPRPSGGFVVASRSYDEELSLVVADDNHELKTFTLGPSNRGAQPIAVHVVQRSSGAERVHVVIGVEATAVTHDVVDLPGGEVTQEQIELL